jgi:hypothetical protein
MPLLKRFFTQKYSQQIDAFANALFLIFIYLFACILAFVDAFIFFFASTQLSLPPHQLSAPPHQLSAPPHQLDTVASNASSRQSKQA